MENRPGLDGLFLQRGCQLDTSCSLFRCFGLLAASPFWLSALPAAAAANVAAATTVVITRTRHIRLDDDGIIRNSNFSSHPSDAINHLLESS